VRRCAQLVACGLLLLPLRGGAADSDIQFWPAITLNHGFTGTWGGHLQIRARFDDDVSETKDLLIRPFISWDPVHSVTLELGYDYLHSYTASSENRVWQAAGHRVKWRDFKLNNRIRLDERFVEDVPGVVVRFRYRFRASHPIAGSAFYAAISDEVFANVNDQGSGPVYGFEQNRLRFALGGSYFKRLRTEAGYEYQYSQSRSGTDRNTHIFFIEVSVDTGTGRPLDWAPQ
jgi:hypothetical protein